MSDCTDTEERIVDFLDGSLSPGEHRAFDEHLGACAACRETVRSYRAISEAYRDCPEVDVDEALAQRILTAAGEPSHGAPRWRRYALLAAAAAVLLFVWLSVPDSRSRPAPEDPAADWLAQGDELLEAGNLPQALSAYEEAERRVEAHGARAEILHRLGEVLFALGEHERALEWLDDLAENHPAYVARRQALTLRGESLAAAGELGRARQAYRSVAREFPEDALEVERRLQDLQRMANDVDWAELQALGYVE